jgi:hypothetical protein
LVLKKIISESVATVRDEGTAARDQKAVREEKEAHQDLKDMKKRPRITGERETNRRGEGKQAFSCASSINVEAFSSDRARRPFRLAHAFSSRNGRVRR